MSARIFIVKIGEILNESEAFFKEKLEYGLSLIASEDSV